MEQLQQNIIHLTGAINAQIDQIRVLESRLNRLENPPERNHGNNQLVSPTNEEELDSVRKLPDCVRDLQIFDGNPTQYVSWVHNVESILRDYEIVRQKPIYGAILRHIRQKIRGPADNALISYNIFDEQWENIKQCLSLHYADKRDIQSLENQLITIRQGKGTICHFYDKINHQLSLIINKIKTEDYSADGAQTLIANYRQRALDVFIRGLHPTLCHLIKVQRPQTLPEAYTACLELENLDFRKNITHTSLREFSMNRQNLRPTYNKNTDRQTNYQQMHPTNTNYIPHNTNPPNKRLDIPNNTTPPRPSQPKPPIPIDIDQSIHSNRINYANRPRSGIRQSLPIQRMFNMETGSQGNTEINTEPEEVREIYNIETVEEAYEDKINYDELTSSTPRPSGIPYMECYMGEDKTLNFLIDTGTNKNYIAAKLARDAVALYKPFKVKTINNSTKISHKITKNFFEKLGNPLPIDFYVLPGLSSFDGIIGDDTLCDLRAIIDRAEHVIHIYPDISIRLLKKTLCQISYLPGQEKTLLEKYANLFEPVSNKQIVDTNVQAEIRVMTTDPIYSKTYPYPPQLKQEVDKQINQMLDDGIIRPSRSPYNSPLWIVPKKQNSLGEKQYRVVIDFKRLNSITIPDTYPIPDINHTLSCLHGNLFFSTIDLTSGFHQIRMKEKDIPKTAFSTPNGKYEFVRLPFGLKNAPAIFQRMINDVLRPLIGICCYVYIDDIIIFGKTKTEHLENIEKVFKILTKAGLKVNKEKSKFFQSEIEFLGYIVSKDGIKPDPKKISAIQNIPIPKNLKDLKGFLGLVSYYRKFIKGCADITRPLNLLTKGENAQISAQKSKNVKITLNDEQTKAFNDLKEMLTSTEILAFPNFQKPFILTTDASNYALGAVLSQGEIGKDRPIAYLSRTLNKTEENYSTIEKEMLAIVWALDKFRMYLYGTKEVKILTDHQPLTFALSNSNNNAKLKRWKGRIEEYNYTLIYKPGTTNTVADALSRLVPEINNLETSSSLQTEHSADEDNSQLIPHMELPINVFKNQIIFSVGKEMTIYEEPHPQFQRHYIQTPHYSRENLINILKEKLNPNIVNGISMPEEYLTLLQETYRENFSRIRVRIAQQKVEDIANEDRKLLIIQEEHKRAHRNYLENKKQILERYYFPQMTKLIKAYTKNCSICNENKYDRHPPKPKLHPTPIPQYPTQILHVDIIELKKEKFITCVDKFSKFVKFFHIKNKTVLHIRQKIIKLLHLFSVPETMVIDNESSFISPIVMNYIEGLGIKIYRTPSQKSEVNGAIERVHSTIIEIFRCLQNEYKDLSTKEIINIAVDRYNNTIHSVTKKRPAEVLFSRKSNISYQNLVDFRQEINQELKHEIERNQKIQLTRQNRKRTAPHPFKSGERIFKKNKQIKSKTKALYEPEIVANDNKVTITTLSGKKIHKSHIKNI